MKIGDTFQNETELLIAMRIDEERGIVMCCKIIDGVVQPTPVNNNSGQWFVHTDPDDEDGSDWLILYS